MTGTRVEAGEIGGAVPPASVADRTPAASDRQWIALLLLFWLAACLWLIAQRWPAIAAMTLPDSDDNLRLLQVRDWIAGQDWFDLRQYRLDPPAGADIHWSRLVDLPLAAAMLAARPLLGAATAERVAVVAVPLLTLLAAMALVARIARATIDPAAWWWAPAMLLMAAPALGMMSPLRIDHHGWQIVALLALAWGIVHPRARTGGTIAGIAIAASLAVGVEMLPHLALGAAAIAIGWAIEPGERDRLRGLSIAAAAGTIAALLLFVPPAGRLSGRCDALSDVYAGPILIGCAISLAGSFAPLATRGRRFALLALAGLLAALPLLGPAGRCLTDPYHAVDPAARALWLDIVAEALPLLAQKPDIAAGTLVLPSIGLAGVAAMLWRQRGNPERRRAWAALGALSLASILLTLLSTRAGVAAQAMAVPGAAALGFLGRARLTASPSLLARVFGSMLLFLAVGGLLPRLAIALTIEQPESRQEAADARANAACFAPASLSRLDAVPAGRALAFIDATPAILVHSHHGGLAGPYHRNGAAIAAVMQAWAGDDTAAHATIRARRVRYVMLCGAMSEGAWYRQRGPDGLYARLRSGRVPLWLRPVPIPASPWSVWRVTD